MDDYKFKDLIDDIHFNREFEFEFNDSKYSITNANNYWYFSNDSENKHMKICEFKERQILIDFVKNLVIENISLQEIFDKKLYINLYIL